MNRPNHRDRLASLRASRTGRWYDIHASTDRAVVRIYDEISWWGITAAQLADEISAISSPEIEVQINSPGGDVFDGLAIFNALRLHPARIVTRVDGLAASAASAIAQAGDHRIMVSSSQMMIHEAWGVFVGPAGDMRDMAALLVQQNTVLAELYAERSGGDVDHLRQLMAAETWFTAQQAVDEGLADLCLTYSPQGELKMNALIYVFVGGLVGLLATLIVHKNELLDVLFNISLGVIGAFVAGWLFTPLFFGIRSVEFSVSALLVSLGGAMLLLIIVNFFRWRVGQSTP